MTLISLKLPGAIFVVGQFGTVHPQEALQEFIISGSFPVFLISITLSPDVLNSICP